MRSRAGPHEPRDRKEMDGGGEGRSLAQVRLGVILKVAMSAASASLPLARALSDLTREGDLYDRLDDRAVRCFACGHACFIPEGRPGVCKVRFNDGGALRVPWGYVGALQCDPIEKKPFFHALPGSLV